MLRFALAAAVTVVTMLVASSGAANAQLRVGFYSRTCPSAETIVQRVVAKAVAGNKGLAAGLIRMEFHDCFVRGCDGSILVNTTRGGPSAEKDSPINRSLRGFEVIDAAKAELEAKCKGVVSCADILAFAARDSFQLTSQSGRFRYSVPSGRKDGTLSLASEVGGNIPGPNFNLPQLVQSFKSKQLDQDDLVTLSGAHSIGRSHCLTIDNRLYNFNGSNTADPRLDANYRRQLQMECPKGSSDTSLVVPLDPVTPVVLDNQYYDNVVDGKGLFVSDAALLDSAATTKAVKDNSAREFAWENKFAAAMVKMGRIGVLRSGKVRSNCAVVNA